MKSRSDPKTIARILEATSFGATKAELMVKLPSLTNSQLRRIFAELVDKDYLRPDPSENGRYVTTHKGLLFLKKFNGSEK
jgi:predicted transcriptional regulator